jgi:hypothetical protein
MKIGIQFHQLKIAEPAFTMSICDFEVSFRSLANRQQGHPQLQHAVVFRYALFVWRGLKSFLFLSTLAVVLVQRSGRAPMERLLRIARMDVDFCCPLAKASRKSLPEPVRI